MVEHILFRLQLVALIYNTPSHKPTPIAYGLNKLDGIPDVKHDKLPFPAIEHWLTTYGPAGFTKLVMYANVLVELTTICAGRPTFALVTEKEQDDKIPDEMLHCVTGLPTLLPTYTNVPPGLVVIE